MSETANVVAVEVGIELELHPLPEWVLVLPYCWRWRMAVSPVTFGFQFRVTHSSVERYIA